MLFRLPPGQKHIATGPCRFSKIYRGFSKNAMTNLPKIGLIADDFTGAMDSGAQFSYSQMGVHFRFSGSPIGDVEIINTASREMLESLPGIGEGKASAILTYRQEHGPFTNLEGLMDVPGIGPGIFASIREFISLED